MIKFFQSLVSPLKTKYVMKTSFIKLVISLVGFSLMAFVSNAATDSPSPDKVIEQARTLVKNAAPHDWKTYADAAKKCIKSKVNYTEALEWLEKSISIKETAYNLEIKGDYWAANQLPTQAVEAYSQAVNVGFAELNSSESVINNQDIKRIQQKIALYRNKK